MHNFQRAFPGFAANCKRCVYNNIHSLPTGQEGILLSLEDQISHVGSRLGIINNSCITHFVFAQIPMWTVKNLRFFNRAMWYSDVIRIKIHTNHSNVLI